MTTDTADKILVFIKVQKKVSPKEIIEHLGFSRQATYKQLAKLLEQGAIDKVGKPPKVFYALINKKKNIMDKIKKSKLPESFRYLMWSYKFEEIDPEEDAERIIVNSVNYGLWEHWQWLAHYYGRERLGKIIVNLPASEFQPGALWLISLLLGIKKMHYATRSDKIKATRSF